MSQAPSRVQLGSWFLVSSDDKLQLPSSGGLLRSLYVQTYLHIHSRGYRLAFTRLLLLLVLIEIQLYPFHEKIPPPLRTRRHFTWFFLLLFDVWTRRQNRWLHYRDTSSQNRSLRHGY